MIRGIIMAELFKKKSLGWLAIAATIGIVIGCIFLIIAILDKRTHQREEVQNNQQNILIAPGIFENTYTYNKDINFTNGWKSDLIEGERFIIVEFGSLKSDSKQGVAIVSEQSKDNGKIIYKNKYLTPSKHGTIKVENFNAFNLGVTAEDGYKWIFNVFDGFREISQ